MLVSMRDTSIRRLLKWMLLPCVLCLVPHSAHSQEPAGSPLRVKAKDLPAIERLANFILFLQGPGGAIQDEPGVKVVNQDSNMEYALIGLGAAYAATNEPKYLAGLENGI